MIPDATAMTAPTIIAITAADGISNPGAGVSGVTEDDDDEFVADADAMSPTIAMINTRDTLAIFDTAIKNRA